MKEFQIADRLLERLKKQHLTTLEIEERPFHNEAELRNALDGAIREGRIVRKHTVVPRFGLWSDVYMVDDRLCLR